MIEPNGGWDRSVDEVKKALDIIDYYLRDGVTVIIFDEETGRYKRLKAFNLDNSIIISA